MGGEGAEEGTLADALLGWCRYRWPIKRIPTQAAKGTRGMGFRSRNRTALGDRIGDPGSRPSCY